MKKMGRRLCVIALLLIANPVISFSLQLSTYKPQRNNYTFIDFLFSNEYRLQACSRVFYSHTFH